MKTLIFIFFILIVPEVSAYNCTALDGEKRDVCNYIDSTAWPDQEKDSLIDELVRTGGSLNGDFNSLKSEQEIDFIQLNPLQKDELKIDEKNKSFVIDVSSLTLTGYVLISFLKKSKFLLSFL